MTQMIRKGKRSAEVARVAQKSELRHLDAAIGLRERLRPLQNRVMARPVTGLEADKSFYDELND